MPVIKVEKNKNYTYMSNFHFKDKRLSWKLKGMLSTMLSLPEDWDYSIAGLTTLSDDGDSSTRSGLKELEKFGYLIRRPIRNNGKIIDWEYTVYEKPLVENPQLVNPQVKNQEQYNTKKSNTNEYKENICINTNTKEIEILNYLNEKAGTRYRAVESNIRLIRGRLKDYTVDDLKKVVDNKVRDWKGTSMQQYLRPETLFGATKIETYLNGLAPTCVEDKKSGNKIGFDGQREYAQEEFNDLCADIDNISLDDM